MSIARNFITRAWRIEGDHEEFCGKPDPVYLAEDYDNAICHAIIDRRRLNLGLWPLEPMNRWQAKVIDRVGKDLTEKADECLISRGVTLGPSDYGRRIVAAIVRHSILSELANA